jgi:hypothetical protein
MVSRLQIDSGVTAAEPLPLVEEMGLKPADEPVPDAEAA